MTDSKRPASKKARNDIVSVARPGPGDRRGRRRSIRHCDLFPSRRAIRLRASVDGIFHYALHDRDPTRQCADRPGHRQGPRRQRMEVSPADRLVPGRWFLFWSCANTFNIAADLAAMARGARLVIGGLMREHALILPPGDPCCSRFSFPIAHFAPALKFLTLPCFPTSPPSSRWVFRGGRRSCHVGHRPMQHHYL